MNIRVDLNYPIKDGTEVVFRSPVDCSQVTGLKVYCPDGSQEFALADAHGNDVGQIDHLFAEDVVVKVILDVTTGMAFVQNADTNAYLEGRFESIENRIGSYVTPEMFGAMGDGVTNDTKAFQNAIDSGCPFIFVPEKTYIVDSLILRSNIHIFGNGTLKMCGANIVETDKASTYCICGDGISNVKIEGLSIEVHNTPTQLGLISNANNITLCDMHIEGNAWSDDLASTGQGPGNGFYFETSKNIIVDGVYLKGTRSGKGIDFYGCEHSIIKNCRVSHTARGGIYVTRNNNNIRVVNNVVEYSAIQMANNGAADGAIDLYAMNKNVTIEGNYVNYYGNSQGASDGIRVKDGENIKVINNIINISNDYSFAGILVQTRDSYISNVSLIGNKIHLEKGYTTNFIRFSTSDDCSINGVVISENVFSSNVAEYTATQTLLLRSKMNNVIITKNKFFVDSEPFAEGKTVLHISAHNITDVRENIIITDNILVDGEISVDKINGGVIDGNIITYRTQVSFPVKITNCNDVFVKNNILKTTRTDITDGVRESGTNTNIIKDNILVTLSEA